ncbi:tripartite tricarboxylate transporter TctB family protein [Fodinicurvata sp. EGI_FJ10296]|uniref:tripartite tricarboxylate transporter TctB family protein n=1 Tax=Fodinicurvata sp. EGI_FJ10296 TaxID=3231908 RepID=UPI003456505F
MAFLREALMPLVVLAFIVAYVSLTQNKPAESTIFPYTIMIFIGALAIGILASSWKLKDFYRVANEEKSRAPLVFALSLLFIVGFVYLGFSIAALAFLVVSLIALGTRPIPSIIISVILTGGIYLLFAIGLGVSL